MITPITPDNASTQKYAGLHLGVIDLVNRAIYRNYKNGHAKILISELGTEYDGKPMVSYVPFIWESFMNSGWKIAFNIGYGGELCGHSEIVFIHPNSDLDKDGRPH
jgi:hypothetical protein